MQKKNTVDVLALPRMVLQEPRENLNHHIFKNVKKSNIIIINNAYNSKTNINKLQEEKESKINRRLQKEGLM